MTRLDLVIWTLLLLLWLAANVVLFRGWVRWENITGHLLTFGILTVLILREDSNALYSWGALLLLKKTAPPPAAPEGLRVAMAATYVPQAEPMEMILKTLDAMVAVRGEHESWVLDEGDDPTLRAEAERRGVLHFTRKGRDEYNAVRGRFKSRTKYGNVNAWLAEAGFARYDIIAQFDSDHAPDPWYLEKTLGYFSDPRIGYVQGPPEYQNLDRSWVARGAWEQDHFNKVLQQALNGARSPLFVGCHNMSRVTALREVGGFADHEADDALITRRLLAGGWKGVFVSETLAQGLAPEDFQGFLKQQYRWAHSLLNLKFFHEGPLLARMPLLVRVAYKLHGTYYLDGLFASIGLILVCYMVSSGDVPVALASVRTAAQVFTPVAVMNLIMYLVKWRYYIHPSHRERLPWRSMLLDLAAKPYYLMAAFKALRGESKNYVITPKTRAATKPLLFLIPHALMMTAVAWVAWRSYSEAIPGTAVLRGSLWIWLALEAALVVAAMLTKTAQKRP